MRIAATKSFWAVVKGIAVRVHDVGSVLCARLAFRSFLADYCLSSEVAADVGGNQE